jgi:hypothetical protein
MPETLHRITYEATIDDAVDVALRLASKTQAFRRQIRHNVIIVGILGGLAFGAAWMSYLSAPAAFDLAVAACGGVAFGVIFAFMFRRFFMKEMRKQHRKIVAEQFGGKPTIPSELELRSDAVWVRQAGMEMTFPWKLCTAIQDNSEDVEMNFSPGICVVRNRHFSSTAERQDFIDTARRLAHPFNRLL